jgi:hypothetical protein
MQQDQFTQAILQQFPEGILLIKAGLMQQQDLMEAHEIAEAANSSMDQVVVNSGFVTEKILRNAKTARQFIQQDLMVESLAVDGLREAAKRNLDLEAALKYLGWGW